jgi:hypothetical protein
MEYYSAIKRLDKVAQPYNPNYSIIGTWKKMWLEASPGKNVSEILISNNNWMLCHVPVFQLCRKEQIRGS